MAQVELSIADSVLSVINSHLDVEYYLTTNGDVAEAGVDPVIHYLLSGINEGRAPNRRESADVMRQLVVAELGRIPSRDDLEQIVLRHRNSASVFKRAIVGIKKIPLKAVRRLRSIGHTAPTRLDDDLHRAPSNFQYLASKCDLLAFNAISALPEAFSSEEEAITYLLSKGYTDFDALNFHLVPDFAFYRSLYPSAEPTDDEALYLRWLKAGAAEGEYISEAHLLFEVGCRSTQISHSFDHQDYIAAYSDLPTSWTRAQALEHFMKSGIHEGRFRFELSNELVKAVEDVIQHTNQSDPARALAAAEKFLLSEHKSDALLLLVARHYLDSHRLIGLKHLLENQDLEDATPIQNFWKNYIRSEMYKRAGLPQKSPPFMKEAIGFEPNSIWVEAESQSLLIDIYSKEELKAKRLLTMGQTPQAQHTLDHLIEHTYQNLYQYGMLDQAIFQRTIDPHRQIRIGILADLFLPQCKLYRVDQKEQQLRQAGFFVEVFDFRKDARKALERVGNFDIWIFYRLPAFFDVLKVIHAANQIGCPTFYEIDDFLFDPDHFPEPIEAYGGNVSVEEYAGLSLSTSYVGGAAKQCTYGIASTPILAEQLSRYVKSGKSFVHRNALGAEHYDAIRNFRRSEASTERVRIFYGSGTRAHKDYFEEVFLSALETVLEECPNVDFYTFGYVNSDRLSGMFPNRIIVSEPEWDISKYWQALSQSQINVAVLKKSLLTDCKSEIKWMEAGMLGVPSIVSATATMEEVIHDGSDGLLARSKEEWVEHLLRLCRDPEFRLSIGSNARTRILQEYGLDSVSETLRDNVLMYANLPLAAVSAGEEK